MSDHLIASNGLIHPRLVGELRYLDSRDDEQVTTGTLFTIIGVSVCKSSVWLCYRLLKPTPALLGLIALWYQARGITMKSSAICLLHVPGATSLPGGAASCSDEDKRAKGGITQFSCIY